MFNKLIDPYPKLSYLTEDDLDFSSFSAVAVPVFPHHLGAGLRGIT
jgi:hypothetical protein